jgi:serine/threonine protein kinase
MAAPLECPGLDRWQALLGDTIPAEQRERYERHLESCPVCQQRVHGAEAVDLERTLGRQLGDPTVASLDPTLVQVLDRLHSLKSPLSTSQVEPADLYFLRPDDRADILGMLGDYEVQEVIGQGGMGVVLKAYEPALHRLVAIKVMAAAVAGSATARRRFKREAQAAAAVVHDHVVTVHGVHEKDGLPYLVMQYISGESLQARLDRSGPLELAEIVRIGLQTASGLAAAHAQGLIHRDIKPANLLLENGLARVKITDFGLARMVDDVALTQQGVVAGTPEYMAPEQARGEAVDHRADLFSLGSVLYAMCTGVPPFRGANPVALLRRVSDEAPKPVREVNADVPAWLEALIERLMAKAPADRAQSAAEVAGLLEGYLAHLRQPTTVPAPVLPFLRPSRRWGSTIWQPARLLDFALYGLLVLLLLAPVALGVGAWLIGGPAEVQREYEQRFDASAEKSQDLKRYGPDAQHYVRFEADGLRIRLPADHPGQRPGIGLATAFGVKGDFEITMGFEILDAFEPGDTNKYTGVSLVVVPDSSGDKDPNVWHRVTPQHASLWRCSGMGINQFLARSNRWNQESLKKELKQSMFPTPATKGRLRLAREGGMLSFSYQADGFGDEFKLLHQDRDFGDADLQAVRLVGSTGGPHSALDARITDLSIRAESLLNRSIADGQQRARAWLLVALVSVTALAGAVLLLVRHRRRARQRLASIEPESAKPEASAGPVSFACSGCGKNLKAKPELIGKRVKCPHCSKVATVPGTPAAAPSMALKRRSWSRVLLLLPVLAGGLGIALWFAAGVAQSRTRSFQEYHQTLKSNPDKPALAAIGPDAAECVQFEPEGLRIKLPTDYAGPPGWHGERPDTGIVVPVTVKGDFDISMNFEILQEPEPADAGHPQTRISLDAGVDRGNNAGTTLSRRVEAIGGTQYVAWISVWKEETGKRHQEWKEFRALSQVGRLRMVRKGPVISYYASDGVDKPFRLLRQYPFGTGDLEDIRIVGSTGGPRAALDVRVTDLRIKAESLRDKSQSAWGERRLPLFIAVGAVIVLALGIVLATRRGRRTNPV